MNAQSILIAYSKDKGMEATNNLIRDYLDSLAKIEDDAIHKRLLKELIQKHVILEKKVDSLLKNTLPEYVAEEIKYSGRFLHLCPDS